VLFVIQVGFTLYTSRRRYVTILRKLIVAVLFALLLTLFGVFDGLGYHGYARELSIDESSALGYNVAFSCDIIYDPITYPSYWVMGRGQVSGTFEISDAPLGMLTGRVFGFRQERESMYLLGMLTWGSTINLIGLLGLTVAIEIIQKRSLYLILLCGMFGFYVFNLLGVLFGIIAGSLVALLLLRLWRDNFIVHF
jgi:hypothetical protein